MTECEICYENAKLKTLIACKHQLCFSCFSKLNNETCPFCRAPIKELMDNFETEYWLNLNPSEWITYSISLKNGTEIIRTSKSSDPQPTWRNDDNVMILKRHKQRKKRRRRYNID
jgi:hypothetical protein